MTTIETPPAPTVDARPIDTDMIAIVLARLVDADPSEVIGILPSHPTSPPRVTNDQKALADGFGQLNHEVITPALGDTVLAPTVAELAGALFDFVNHHGAELIDTGVKARERFDPAAWLIVFRSWYEKAGAVVELPPFEGRLLARLQTAPLASVVGADLAAYLAHRSNGTGS